MKNKMKTVQIFFILLAMTVLSAYKYPEELPDWQNIQSYKLNKLKFGETTVEEFKDLSPQMNGKPEADNLYIMAEKFKKNDFYDKVRVCFNHDKLDWIEFSLKNDIRTSEFVYLYGVPKHVNTTHNEDFDYFDYGFFNVSTDKNHKIAHHLTVFHSPDCGVFLNDLDSVIPDIKSFNFVKFLKPGILTEEDFKNRYNGLIPYKKDKFDTNATYTLDNELGKARDTYSKIILNFKNGILASLYLTPINLKISQIQDIYGSKHKVEALSRDLNLYEYKNFFVAVDENTRTVKSVAITSTY